MILNPRLYVANVETLMDAGYEALEDEEYERAIAIAKILRRRNHSSTFEIEARARYGQGRKQEAIQILEEGVEVAPQARSLWDYLGEYYSDDRRYDEAIQAFETSKQCPHPQPAIADLNIAIVFSRQERHEEALDRLQSIPPDKEGSPPRVVVDAWAIRSLVGLRRYEEALEVDPHGLLGSKYPYYVAMLLAYRSQALWYGRVERKSAEDLARVALSLDELSEPARWILRQMRCRRSPEMKAMRIIVHGQDIRLSFRDSDMKGFYRVYDVAAETEAEALSFVREEEDEEVCGSLEISSVETVEPAPDELAGVISCVGGYSFY